MPSWDRFAAQDAGYQDDVLPAGLPVLSVEAGVTFGGSATPTSRSASIVSVPVHLGTW
jgi:transketolase